MIQLRRSPGAARQILDLLGLLAIALVGLWGLSQFRNPEHLQQAGIVALIGTGSLGIWRWSWYGIHVLRSRFYVTWKFKHWRKQANRFDRTDLPTVALVVPTYHEQPWITERVFSAIAQAAAELDTLTTVVAVTTAAEIEAIDQIFDRSGVESIRFVPVVDTGRGKRGALAEGLRAAALYQPEVVVLMDGDCVLSRLSLRNCLPFFRIMPKLGGITTDETVEVQGSRFFCEWLHLRFAQRHLYMCSHALSRKVLCLTGRFSLFRGEAALDPSFAAIIENDVLNDWLWGRFKFLSGDDKSSWFWVLRAGYEMLYVPDVSVVTIETIEDRAWLRMYQNMRRWFGNMIRSGNRAIALGPLRVGGFIWLCLIDQRISFWTSLAAPSLMLIYALKANWAGVGLVVSWLLFSRPIGLLVLRWGRPFHLKPIHVVQDPLAQWISALIKIFTQMHLAQQRWSNRGNQRRDAAGIGWRRLAKLGTARFLLVAQASCFAIALLWLLGTISPVEIEHLWWRLDRAEAELQPLQVVEATQFGVTANDNQNDASALQALVDHLPPTGTVQINLPHGEIQLDQPLKLSRSQTILQGQGTEITIITCDQTAIEAISHTSQPLTAIELSNFTVIQYGQSAIVLKHLHDSLLKSIRFEGFGKQPVYSSDVKNLQLQYVAIDGHFDPAVNENSN